MYLNEIIVQQRCVDQGIILYDDVDNVSPPHACGSTIIRLSIDVVARTSTQI